MANMAVAMYRLGRYNKSSGTTTEERQNYARLLREIIWEEDISEVQQRLIFRWRKQRHIQTSLLFEWS